MIGVLTIATACLTVYLYIIVPKGFFPQQDTGRISGAVQAAQDISFPAMSAKMTQFVNIVMKDPNMQTIVGFAGGNTALNQGRMFITLKPLGRERRKTSDQIIGELRRKLAVVPGATLYMQSSQDLTDWRPAEPGAISVHVAGGRLGPAEFLGSSATAETADPARTARCEYRPAG